MVNDLTSSPRHPHYRPSHSLRPSRSQRQPPAMTTHVTREHLRLESFTLSARPSGLSKSK